MMIEPDVLDDLDREPYEIPVFDASESAFLRFARLGSVEQCKTLSP